MRITTQNVARDRHDDFCLEFPEKNCDRSWLAPPSEGYDPGMPIPLREFTWCLEHQALEDQMSPVGLVCPECKRRLYVDPPAGLYRTWWESQPAAWSPDREPCFVYTLAWDDFRIRSLHAAGDEYDLRSLNVSLELPLGIAEDDPEFPWL